MTCAIPTASRQGELWRRLEGVNDPELDEPVTDMGFIERADIAADGSVDVGFRLPTYWCSPNFAFLMLEDVRIALEALSWAPAFRITLHDHMFADEVNKGIAEGRGFAEIFDALSDQADLGDLREKFRHKAFQRRQEAAILDLKRLGVTDREIVRMTLATYGAINFDDPEARKHRQRYLEALSLRWPDFDRHNAIVVDYDGNPVTAEALPSHLAALRSVRINMEFNGALCRGLKESRYKELEMIDGEPTLVDFIMDRVARPDASPPAACNRT